MPPTAAGRMDDRQPSLGLPPASNRNLANTTNPIPPAAATPRQIPHAYRQPRPRQRPSNRRLDRPRSFMDDIEGCQKSTFARTTAGTLAAKMETMTAWGRKSAPNVLIKSAEGDRSPLMSSTPEGWRCDCPRRRGRRFHASASLPAVPGRQTPLATPRWPYSLLGRDATACM